MKIDKGIPIPKKGGRCFGITALMRGMEIGDSFELPKSAARNGGLYAVAGYVGIKITRRTENGATRVWRIA